MASKKLHRSIPTRELLQDLMKHTNVLSLFEFANIVNASLDLNFILGTLLRTLMGKFLISSGMVLLITGKNEFKVACVRGIHETVQGTRIKIAKEIRSFTYLRSMKSRAPEYYRFLRSHFQEYILPIVVHGHCIGIVTLGERKGQQKKFTKAEQELIVSILTLSASAIEKARMIDELNTTNRKLAQKIQELNTLFELSKEFNLGLDAQRVLRLLTFALLGHMGVQQYVICIFQKGSPTIVEIKGIVDGDLIKHLQPFCDIQKPLDLNNALRKKQLRPHAEYLLRLGLITLIPMILHNRVYGLLCLGKNIRNLIYSSSDLEFLYSMASLATIALDNTRLLKEAIEKQRMEDEILIAREIQRGLFPKHLPQTDFFEIAAINIPSKEVGGDYYDVIMMENKKYLISIGDVAGKGYPASLLMANVQAALRMVSKMNYSVKEMVRQVNDLVCENVHSGTKFITFVAGIYDPQSRTLTYTNAGHNPPILLHANGDIEFLTEGGMILGIFTQVTYDEKTLLLSSGDVLVFYTDGISEAMNSENQEFTEEKLIDIIRSVSQRSAQDILTHIYSAVLKHRETTSQSDDITLLVLKVL